MAKKMKIDFKQIDWKDFLLRKGEKVGLYTALGVMALMVLCGLFWPGKGVFSGSPSSNAKVLREQGEQKQNLVRTSAPGEAEKQQLAQIDPTLLRADERGVVAPEQFYAAVDLFEGRAKDDNLRRAPRILPAEEYRVTYLGAQVNQYVFSEDFKKILMVKGGESRGVTDGPPMPGMGQGARGGSNPARFLQGLTRPPAGGSAGGPPGGIGAYMMGGMGRGGMGRGCMMMGGLGNINRYQSGARGGRGQFTEKRDKVEPIWVNVDEIDKHPEARLAEAALPVRMVVVEASFPLKEQLEQVRKALRLPSAQAALQETRFRGFNVMRREVGPDGKAENWDEKKHLIDVGDAFTKLIVLTGKRFDEKADKGLEQVLITGLYMGYPKQLRDDQYPRADEHLEKVKKALEDAKAKDIPPVQPAPKSGLGSREGIDPFYPTSGAPPDQGGPGMEGMPPGGFGPGGYKPPTGSKPGQGMTAEGGSFYGNVPQNWAPPDYCLLRFIDPTVEPGKTYEYRYQIKLYNPNYKRDKEVAYPNLAREDTIRSPWFDVPARVVVPPDRHVYVVDEKKLDPKFPDSRFLTQDMVALQLQRWVDEMKINSRVGYPVGDWAVVERLLAYRGEYVPGRQKVELPIHDVEHEGFVLASEPKSRDRRVMVEFLADDELLLAAFDGGRQSIEKFVGMKDDRPDTVTVEDESPVEVLFLSADGKLLARNSAADAADKDRKTHRDEWKARVKEAKEGGDKKKDSGGKEPDVFGPGGGKGSGN